MALQKIRVAPSLMVTLAWIAGGAAVYLILDLRGGGLWIGGLIGYLLGQVLHQRTVLRELIEHQAAPPGETALPAAPEAVTRPEPATWAEPRSDAGHAEAPQVSAPAPRPSSRLAAQWQTVLEQALRWLRRGNPLARIGIVILFFGATFLARYSADRGLLPLELRFALLAIGSVTLVALGWRLRTRRRVLSRSLQGGGVAGFYLTVFAALRLYDLLPVGLAGALLVLVALTGAVLAVAQNALSLAVLATAGGFLAPVLLSTGSGDHVALFSYYAVLNLGVIAVAWFRAWRVLNLLGFVFTFGVTSAFRGLAYSTADRLSTDLFLLLFFLMYVAVSVLFSWRQKPDLKGYVSGSLVFGLPVVVFTLHGTLVAEIPFALAWSALGFGAFYLLGAALLWRGGRDGFRLLAEAFAALGIIFASLAIPLAFDRQTTAAMWAIEGAGLLWLGLRQSRRLARAFGVLLQAAGGIGYLAGLHALPVGVPLLNSAWIGSTLLAGAGVVSGWWLYRSRAALARYEALAPLVAGLWGLSWWLGGGLAEIDRSVRAPSDFGAALLFASASAALLFACGRRLHWPLPQQMFAGLWPLITLAGLGLAGLRGHPLPGLAQAGWMVHFGVLYAVLWRIDRAEIKRLFAPRPWLHALGAWSLALILAWELDWRSTATWPGVWAILPYGLAAAILLWSFSAAWPRWPVAAHVDTYRRLAGVPVAVFACLWFLEVNLGQSGDSGLLYLPLLNPLDVSIGLVLMALLRWWLAFAPGQRNRLWPWGRAWLWGVVVLGLFLWINSALVRSLHHAVGTPLDLRGLMHSFLVQASLSVFWSLLGLGAMFLANRRAWRPVWLAGAALMGVVVVKLFLIDLDGRGGLARIVSFMSVGGLLLLAGYLSPLPPARPVAQEKRA